MHVALALAQDRAGPTGEGEVAQGAGCFPRVTFLLAGSGATGHATQVQPGTQGQAGEGERHDLPQLVKRFSHQLNMDPGYPLPSPIKSATGAVSMMLGSSDHERMTAECAAYIFGCSMYLGIPCLVRWRALGPDDRCLGCVGLIFAFMHSR